MRSQFWRWAAWAAVALTIQLAGCGGGSTSSSSTTTSTNGLPPSRLKTRVFVSNQGASLGQPSGTIVIVDDSKDAVGGVISVGGAIGGMVVTSDKKLTLLFETQSNQLVMVDNSKEAVTSSLPLGAATQSFVVLPDNNTGFAAGRSAGAVAVFDITKLAVTASIGIPTVRTLVLSHSGTKLLAFSDDTDSFAVIDTATKTATSIAGRDRPTYGVFSADDAKAYILSCGAECGGATARVTVLDVASNTLGASVPVSGATIGLLDSNNNLFVAGTANGAGKLDVLSATTLAVSKSGVAISDGVHTVMSLGANNKLFIGARTCNNVTTGCLTIYDTSAGTAVIGTPKGDVTSALPISGRSVVYVAEGGELRVYDTTTNAEILKQPGNVPPVDIVGKAIDVKAVDQ